ncbi:MAG: pyridoxamine 5'-phosphate oxidase family protein [Janibacter sp.]|nr:pyridoxamine 5'-phosphate oxidase family protein [Janibacter sp.]
MTTIQSPGRSSAPVDHRGLDVLTLDECLLRIASRPMGRVAFQDKGEVIVLPVHHVIDDGIIAFRTRWDSTLAAAVNHESVTFQVDHYDPLEQTGWSVLVRGTAGIVSDPVVGDRLEELLDVAWQGPPEEAFWTAIRWEEVTGRELGSSRSECGCC